MTKPSDTVKKLAAVHNLDAKDINSDIYQDRPLIPETDLSVTVQAFCRAGQPADAAKAIEIAVRRAYQLEGAS